MALSRTPTLGLENPFIRTNYKSIQSFKINETPNPSKLHQKILRIQFASNCISVGPLKKSTGAGFWIRDFGQPIFDMSGGFK